MQPEHSGISRRAILRGTLWISLGSLFAAAAGVFTDFLWQRNVSGFGGVVTAGELKDFPAGSKTKIQAGKFWLVSLTEAEGGPGYLALWQKCPHLGCTVPWEKNFKFKAPGTDEVAEGWFRCPCHLSTYSSAGVRVYGPAPRSMDRMAVRITADGRIEVDTREISKGSTDNATFAVRP
jgi:cytochrome b6-f complex iron-sulfur subunit